MSKRKAQLIVALDVDSQEKAIKLVEALGSLIEIFKVGSQLFTACGPTVVQEIIKRKKKIFLDLKFHDIPNTVASSTSAAVLYYTPIAKQISDSLEKQPGLYMLTVHTSGGEAMLKEAVKAAARTALEKKVARPFIVGVTILTSEANNVNLSVDILKKACLAKDCGLDGVVASPQEAKMIRQKLGQDFVIVTPGIRPSGSEDGDQMRIATPKDAVLSGSDFLVVGRPIVQAKDPYQAAKSILEEIK